MTKIKRVIGVCLGMAYVGGCILTILVVGLSVEPGLANAIFYSFLIQTAMDMFVSQPLKVGINMFILLYLVKNKAMMKLRKCLLLIIDPNLVGSFI